MKLQKDIFDQQFLYLLQCESQMYQLAPDHDYTFPPEMFTQIKHMHGWYVTYGVQYIGSLVKG